MPNQSPDFHIRSARLDEKAALEALQLAASLMWDSDREALLANPDAVAIPEAQFEAGQVYVAERAGEIVGLGVVLPRFDGEAELDGLFTRPDAWRGGVGRALVAEAMARARAWRSDFLHVIGNPNAEGFYLACGFEHCGEEQTQFGPAMRMRLRL